MRSKAPTYHRVRISKVGFWYVVIACVVGVAATNTGNNALYLVESVVLALLVVSGLLSRRNLRSLELELEAPAEIFANQPFTLRYYIANRDRFLARRLLVIEGIEGGVPALIPFLARSGRQQDKLDVLIARRGLYQIPYLLVSSIFPLGLFRKTLRYRVELSLLVYPEVFPLSPSRFDASGDEGDEPSRKRGWGHDLLSLRRFRDGDDPRAIHWKQTARTGDLIFMERETEQGRRLSIVLDNAVGELVDQPSIDRFERLVSEAASAADHHLEQGFEVELVTREQVVPFGAGRAQKARIMETLALIEALPAAAQPLAGGGGGVRMRLGMDSLEREAS